MGAGVSAWGSSFGPCAGGSGETILVEAIREAAIVSAVSASVATPQLAAEIIAATTASVSAISLSATVTSTTEAEL
jgi:hypothetical protein